MSDITINLDYGTKQRLLTKGKMCNDNIVVGAAKASLQSKTVTPSLGSQVVTPDDEYHGLSSVSISAMPKTTQATPTLEVDSDGLVTAMCTQTAGYVDEGTVFGELQLTRQAGKTVTPQPYPVVAVQAYNYTTGQIVIDQIQRETATITPSTAAQTVTPSSGKYFSSVTVNGDANLIPENIVSGKTIFGVAGTANGVTAISGATVLGSSTQTFNEVNGGFSLQTLLDYYEGNIAIAISSDLNIVGVWNGVTNECDEFDQGGNFVKAQCNTQQSDWTFDASFTTVTSGEKFAFIYLKKNKLITFTVNFHDGSAYSFNAIEGMTFAEFCASEYNVNEEDPYYILACDGSMVCDDESGVSIKGVTANTVISNGATYGTS